ncbi:MAG: outer membrane protein assembly factor [Sneathiella sp.]|nr:outer membrane protein assembly factor [Sneathiella sp.]
MFRQAFHIALISCALIAATTASVSAEDAGETSSASNWSYEVVIPENLPNNLSELLEQSSGLVRLAEKPPISYAGLQRRVEDDAETFRKVLKSEGYYAGQIKSQINRGSVPHQVTFQIDAGPQYKISNYAVQYHYLQTIPPQIDLSPLAIQHGMPARSEPILTSQKQVIAQLANMGFPFAKIKDQNAVVDYNSSSMSVTLMVETGPYIQMGELQLIGLNEVNKEHMRRLSGWVNNRPYRKKDLETLRRVYLDTGLFDAVRYEIPSKVNLDASVPVTFTFGERKHRSVGAGMEYSSSEGLGAQAYWEHRNFFGQGETVRGDIYASEIRQELSVSFVKPDVFTRHQSFKAEADVKRENTDAYTAESARVYAGLDRRWGSHWTLGGGLFAEFSNIEENGDTENFAYFGAPFTASFDNTDDLLDPSEGVRFGATLTPHFGLNAASSNFVTTELYGSTYYSVLDEKRLILALRGKVGSLVGDSTADIPAVKRFYAGGGGSIRGYEYQLVGPLDGNNDPSGGRSVIEVGAEARIRITDTIGIVPFIEGGDVYEEMAPDFSGEFQWAAGLGARYYTPFGPVRLDVAVPLNPRDNVDDKFQFYISIGQAF